MAPVRPARPGVPGPLGLSARSAETGERRPWLPAAARRPIPTSRKSGTGGKGGEAWHQGGRNRIRGVGEVGSSPTRLSAAARVERGRAVVRGRSAVVGGRLLSREAVRRSRGAQDGGDEAEGGTAWADVVEVLGGGRRSLVRGERQWGAASRGGGRQLAAQCSGCGRGDRRGAGATVWRGSERWSGEGGRKGCSTVEGGSLYSRQRRWTTAGGETAAATPWARQGGSGRCLRAVDAVWTRSARGSDRAADGGPHTVLIFFLI
jgi:hypothetical protein